jgi:hypothetical protein
VLNVSIQTLYSIGLSCKWPQILLQKVKYTYMRAFWTHSKSELCGDGVTVSFLKYLPWQAMHFLQHSTHFSKTCYRLLITLKFLVQELPFHGWKNLKITWGNIWIEFRVQLGKSGSMETHQNICHTVQISPHVISELFQPWKESSKTNFEVIISLKHVSKKWVEHYKKCTACQGRYFEKKKKETITAPPQSSDSK